MRPVAYPTTDYDRSTITADDPHPVNLASHRFEVAYDGQPVGVVQFQNGPRHEPESTPGLFTMHLLAIVLDQLDGFQLGPYATTTNAQARDHIGKAMALLTARRDERHNRGALGTHKV